MFQSLQHEVSLCTWQGSEAGRNGLAELVQPLCPAPGPSSGQPSSPCPQAHQGAPHRQSPSSAAPLQHTERDPSQVEDSGTIMASCVQLQLAVRVWSDADRQHLTAFKREHVSTHRARSTTGIPSRLHSLCAEQRKARSTGLLARNSAERQEDASVTALGWGNSRNS